MLVGHLLQSLGFSLARWCPLSDYLEICFLFGMEDICDHGQSELKVDLEEFRASGVGATGAGCQGLRRRPEEGLMWVAECLDCPHLTTCLAQVLGLCKVLWIRNHARISPTWGSLRVPCTH